MTQPSHVSGTIKTITPFDLSDKTKTVESVWSMDDIKEAAEYLKNGLGFSEFALRQFSEAVLGILADHKTPASDPQPALGDKSEPQAIQSSDLVSMEAAIAVAKEAISKIVYDQWFKSHYPVTSHGHQYVGEAVEAAIHALPTYAKLKEETK